jgi:hypothetical protein
MSDTEKERHALEMLQTFPAFLLAAVVRGELDLNVLAKRELASRGLNHDGRWVGFDRAAQLVPPPYETRKRLREATLAVGRKEKK